MQISLNPDSTFVRAKRKQIKSNNGLCSDMIEEYMRYKKRNDKHPYCNQKKTCPCSFFIDGNKCGWCPGDLYYKTMEEDEQVNA